MGFIDIYSLSEAFNSAFDKIAVIAFWVGLALMAVRYIRKSIATEKDLGKNLYMAIVVCLGAILLAFIIYRPFPELLVALFRQKLDLATIRWILLYLVLILWSLRVRHKDSGKHGVWFVILIMTTLLLGWVYDRWLGILFMSVPVLSMYLYMISRIAQVILPASNPEDKLEAQKKNTGVPYVPPGCSTSHLDGEGKNRARI